MIWRWKNLSGMLCLSFFSPLKFYSAFVLHVGLNSVFLGHIFRLNFSLCTVVKQFKNQHFCFYPSMFFPQEESQFLSLTVWALLPQKSAPLVFSHILSHPHYVSSHVQNMLLYISFWLCVCIIISLRGRTSSIFLYFIMCWLESFSCNTCLNKCSLSDCYSKTFMRFKLRVHFQVVGDICI